MQKYRKAEKEHGLVDLKTRCPLFLVCLILLFVGVTYNSLE